MPNEFISCSVRYYVTAADPCLFHKTLYVSVCVLERRDGYNIHALTSYCTHHISRNNVEFSFRIRDSTLNFKITSSLAR